MMTPLRPRFAHQRLALGALATIAVAVVAGMIIFGQMWFQRPPFVNVDAHVEGQEMVVQLWGDCCHDLPEHVRDVSVDSLISPERHRVAFTVLGWLDGTRAWVDGDTASFRYLLSRDYWPAEVGSNSEGLELYECTATDLRAGDSITNGPVTIEVLAVHDMTLNRNNAIDLRITFDPDGIDDAAFDPNC